jgi:hypothetical protein
MADQPVEGGRFGKSALGIAWKSGVGKKLGMGGEVRRGALVSLINSIVHVSNVTICSAISNKLLAVKVSEYSKRQKMVFYPPSWVPKLPIGTIPLFDFGCIVSFLI